MLEMQFQADMAAGTLKVRREFAAPRARVWECYTKSELLDRWYAPKPLSTRTKHMDFRVGGYWHYAMIDPSGTEYWSRNDYLEIDEGRSFAALDGFSNAEGELNPDLPRSRIELTFADSDGQTLVETRVKYDSPEDLQKVIDMGMEEGLRSTLERLDELLVALD